MAGIHSNRGAKRAREARRELGLEVDAPLRCILSVVEERAGLPVFIARLPADVAGACYRAGDGTLLWVNASQWPARQRFTLAHELGHAWCEHDGRLEVDTLATLNGKTTTPAEIEANAFAAEFLVPHAGLAAVIDGEPTLDEVVVISAHYGVSAIMVVYRLKQLRLASDARIERLEAEIRDRLHGPAFERLGLEPLADRLARIEQLPYLSAALRGSALGAALRGGPVVDGRMLGAIDRLLA